MGLKKHRPVTPTLRHTVVPDFAELTRSKPVKSLTQRQRRDQRGAALPLRHLGAVVARARPERPAASRHERGGVGALARASGALLLERLLAAARDLALGLHLGGALALIAEVARDATKIDIKRAIEIVFSVKVDQVRTQRLHGKVRRTGRFVGRRSDWKKAIVTLGPDQKIELFEQI